MDGNPQSFAEFWQNIWQMLVDINILRLVWALLVLIVGWLVAWLLANLAGEGAAALRARPAPGAEFSGREGVRLRAEDRKGRDPDRFLHHLTADRAGLPDVAESLGCGRAGS